MDASHDEQLALEVIEEITQEMRQWTSGDEPRRGVRLLIKSVWMRLLDREWRPNSREDLCRDVQLLGEIGRWDSCDIWPVREGLRTGKWNEVRPMMSGSKCAACRRREDVMVDVSRMLVVTFDLDSAR